MKIFELLHNPIIKIIGIVAVLYFALFANKQNPESLGNRLSPTNVKKNFQEAKEKSKFIAVNVKKAQEIAKNQQITQSETDNSYAKISVVELETGQGEMKIECGNEVEISIGIYNQQEQQIEFINSVKIIVGSKKDQLIEENVIGMRQGGIRNINILRGFQTDSQKLQQFLKQGDVKYQVTVLNLKKPLNSTFTCNYQQ